MCGKDGDNRTHHLILDGKDVLKRAVVPLGPAMGTRRGIDKLRRNTNTVAPSRPTWRTSIALPLYWKLEFRAITNNSEKRDRSVMMSSTTRDKVDFELFYLPWV